MSRAYFVETIDESFEVLIDILWYKMNIISMDKTQSWDMHMELGIAYPYDNRSRRSEIEPYDEANEYSVTESLLSESLRVNINLRQQNA